MNIILQNVAAALSAVSVTVLGMASMESRYLDEAEAALQYQDRRIAEQQIAAQLAVNTATAATLIDLRIRQYQYTAESTTSPAEREAMLEQTKIAQAELRNLSTHYNRATRLFPTVFSDPVTVAGSH